ncbi:MAG: ABC transporter permease [Planctomycetes bacterium]|nr:ABC transporter permease [Planctomycetota bacterium]
MKKRIALIAVAAVSLVVMLVLVVLSIMSGLVDDIRPRNHNWVGDIVVGSNSLVGFPYYEEFLAELEHHEKTTAATAIIKTFGLLGQGEEMVELYGVDLEKWCLVTNFADTLYYPPTTKIPSFTIQNNFSLTAEQREHGCITGIYLILNHFTGGLNKKNRSYLENLGVNPQGNAELPITIMGLTSRGTLATDLGERRIFRYVNDSDTGLVLIDATVIYVDFEQLQKLTWMDGADLNPKRVSEIRIKLKDGADLETGRTEIATAWDEFVRQKQGQQQANLLDNTFVQTWKEYRRSRIAPMEREKTMMIALFGMIAMVAVFIVIAIFYMIVTEKIKDLGIIKSVGGSNWSVGQIFLGYGLLVGIIGAIIGTALGCTIVWNSNEIESGINNLFIWGNGVFENWDWQYRFGEFHLWDPEVYAIDSIPNIVNFPEAAIIALIAVLASVIGAALPARRAAKLQVVETLRAD